MVWAPEEGHAFWNSKMAPMSAFPMGSPDFNKALGASYVPTTAPGSGSPGPEFFFSFPSFRIQLGEPGRREFSAWLQVCWRCAGPWCALRISRGTPRFTGSLWGETRMDCRKFKVFVHCCGFSFCSWFTNSLKMHVTTHAGS